MVFPLFLVVRLPLGDEFWQKSLFIVVLQFSIKLKRFNSQIKGVKMAFVRLDVCT
jgi:hypothetical protein